MSILLLGDILIDKYFNGVSNELCPEVPVPVVKVNNVTSSLGGIGNVVRSVIGFFNEVHFLSSFCIEDEEILTKSFNKVTTTKSTNGGCATNNSSSLKYKNFIQENRQLAVLNRVMVGAHCLSRYDYPEEKGPMSRENEDKMLSYIRDYLLEDLTIVILSDYSRGALTKRFCRKLIPMLKEAGIVVLVDPIEDDWTKFEGATMIKPNREEAGYVFGIPIIDAESGQLFAESALHKYQIDLILNTLDKEGMALYHLSSYHGEDEKRSPLIDSDVIVNGNDKSIYSDSNEERVSDSQNGIAVSNNTRDVYTIQEPCHSDCKPIDVIGCGDAIIAAIAVFIKETKDWNRQLHQMMKILSLVGRKAVETDGCYILNPTDWAEFRPRNINSTKKSIVFTNGCFDLLHCGHIRLLNFCKGIGDHLILAVNSDESVRLNKGPERPINSLNHRIKTLKELNLADEIIIFDEKTPLELIRRIKPDFLVKGSDYTVEQIIGQEYAKEVVLFDSTLECSSSDIIQKVLDSYGKHEDRKSS
ncbi:bifunctional protein HldE-like [Clytia hemisphaerica]|uniref:Cytidyltransferase-like domain-containing protein n=1 Tax=Clytia hemisphaerica TaxID=252671 RepID=A0A7M5U539_9CNID